MLRKRYLEPEQNLLDTFKFGSYSKDSTPTEKIELVDKLL